MRVVPFCRLLLIAAATLMSGNALAGKRVALVIGNSDYQHVALRNLPCKHIQCDEIWSLC